MYKLIVHIKGWKFNQKFFRNKKFERINKEFKTAARNTLKKTARTNIRISQADLEGLKLITAQEGVGYQTLISGILHKVASGQLQIQT